MALRVPGQAGCTTLHSLHLDVILIGASTAQVSTPTKVLHMYVSLGLDLLPVLRAGIPLSSQVCPASPAVRTHYVTSHIFAKCVSTRTFCLYISKRMRVANACTRLLCYAVKVDKLPGMESVTQLTVTCRIMPELADKLFSETGAYRGCDILVLPLVLVDTWASKHHPEVQNTCPHKFTSFWDYKILLISDLSSNQPCFSYDNDVLTCRRD